MNIFIKINAKKLYYTRFYSIIVYIEMREGVKYNTY